MDIALSLAISSLVLSAISILLVVALGAYTLGKFLSTHKIEFRPLDEVVNNNGKNSFNPFSTLEKDFDVSTPDPFADSESSLENFRFKFKKDLEEEMPEFVEPKEEEKKSRSF